MKSERQTALAWSVSFGRGCGGEQCLDPIKLCPQPTDLLGQLLDLWDDKLAQCPAGVQPRGEDVLEPELLLVTGIPKFPAARRVSLRDAVCVDPSPVLLELLLRVSGDGVFEPLGAGNSCAP